MTVGSLCQRAVDLADESESVQVAAARMRSRNVGSLLVLDPREQPVGILTDRDLALRVVGEGRSPLATRVGDAMTPIPIRVDESMAVEEALAIMRKHGVRRLAVVGKNRALVGVLSIDDVIMRLAAEFRSVTGVLERSSPGAVNRERTPAKRKHARVSTAS